MLAGKIEWSHDQGRAVATALKNHALIAISDGSGVQHHTDMHALILATPNCTRKQFQGRAQSVGWLTSYHLFMQNYMANYSNSPTHCMVASVYNIEGDLKVSMITIGYGEEMMKKLSH